MQNQDKHLPHIRSAGQRYEISEILPHLCVAKCGYVSNSGQAEVIQYVLYKPENWLSMADHFCVSLMLSA